MHKHLLFCLVLAAFNLSTEAQRTKKMAEAFAEAAAIDSFIVYHYFCSGSSLVADSCKSISSYLIWKKNNHSFIKEFNVCKVSAAFDAAIIDPVGFYTDNHAVVDGEEIKTPQGYTYVKKGNCTDTVMTSMTIDHSCSDHISITINKKTVDKEIDNFYLSFADFENGGPNLNYASNQKTTLKILLDKIKALKKYYFHE